jgi:hypothetical protein
MGAKRSSRCVSVTRQAFVCLLAGCTASEETRRTAERAVAIPLLPHGALASVSSDDMGVIAVGRDSAGRGAILLSPDGAKWMRVPAESTAHLPPLVATSRWRRGAIAFGTNGQLSVWISTDSRSWRRAEIASAPFAGGGVTDLVHGGPGLVAVGYREDPGETSEPVGGLIWTSTDGMTWRRTGDEKLFDLNEGNMTAVTRGGPGFVVAGSDIDGSVLWTSTDGLQWTRLARDSVFRAAGISAITELDGGMLALGARFPDIAPLAWRSSDGQTWVREAGHPGSGPRGGVADVTRFGSLLVAVGRDSAGGAIWTSADGRAWARVEPAP